MTEDEQIARGDRHATTALTLAVQSCAPGNWQSAGHRVEATMTIAKIYYSWLNGPSLAETAAAPELGDDDVD